MGKWGNVTPVGMRKCQKCTLIRIFLKNICYMRLCNEQNSDSPSFLLTKILAMCVLVFYT